MLQPADRWHTMIGLRQAVLGTMSPNFGAVLRSPWLFPMEAGLHRVAFRCAGNWSDDVEMYWETATVPR